MHASMHGTDILTAHMALHILAMNVAAPLLILLLRHLRFLPRHSLGGLALATAVQIVALWSVHAPAILAVAQEAPAKMLAVHGALFLTSVWFWHEVVAAIGDRRWRAVMALLITAKLFCLLGALMVFAPQAFVAAIGDQQSAGLLMLTACPITYLLAAGIIVRGWLLDIEARSAQRAT